LSETDRRRWDERHSEPQPDPGPPALFAPYEELFPARGIALDLACGKGGGTFWLAARGLEVWGMDVSAVAIAIARGLADSRGLKGRCRFDVVDLDDGLPEGPVVDVVLCHLFRDARLDDQIMERLAPGGLLALAVLSSAGGRAGPYRSSLNGLISSFRPLTVLAAGDAEGKAWLLGRKAATVAPSA
jgi:SAM-dependent methyltransferase